MEILIIIILVVIVLALLSERQEAEELAGSRDRALSQEREARRIRKSTSAEIMAGAPHAAPDTSDNNGVGSGAESQAISRVAGRFAEALYPIVCGAEKAGVMAQIRQPEIKLDLEREFAFFVTLGLPLDSICDEFGFKLLFATEDNWKKYAAINKPFLGPCLHVSPKFCIPTRQEDMPPGKLLVFQPPSKADLYDHAIDPYKFDRALVVLRILVFISRAERAEPLAESLQKAIAFSVLPALMRTKFEDDVNLIEDAVIRFIEGHEEYSSTTICTHVSMVIGWEHRKGGWVMDELLRCADEFIRSLDISLVSNE